MSDRPISVRPGTVADLNQIVRFNTAIAKETEGKELDQATILAGARTALEDPDRSLYFLAEVDGVIAGQTMVTFEWSDWRNGLFWWIQSVYVDPSFRRRGVFRALYNHIRDAAKARPDVCGIRLYVVEQNTRALDTYRSLGMTITDYRLCEEDWPSRLS